MSNSRKLLLVMALALVGAVQTQASIIVYPSRAAFDAAHPNVIFEGWDGFAAGTTFADGSTTNGITYSSAGPGSAIVTSAFLTTTSPNGLGDTSNGEFFGGAQSMTFSFDEAMVAFGIDINTFATTNGSYTATTSNGDVIGSFFDPFPGFGTGQFVGFYSSVPFTSVTITPTTGFSYTLDSMRLVTPEPATLAVFGLMGIAGAGHALRRRKAAV